MIIDNDFKEFKKIYSGKENSGFYEWREKKVDKIKKLSIEKKINELERLEEKLDQLEKNKSTSKEVVEQILKEFFLLICSLIITATFTIVQVLGDFVSQKTNEIFSVDTIEKCFEMFEGYYTGTLELTGELLWRFYLFFVILMIGHALLAVFDSNRTKNNLREIRYYRHLVELCKKELHN